MSDINNKARENLQSDNVAISEIMKIATRNCITKAGEFASEAENPRDLNECMSVIEKGGRTLGLTAKEIQTNIQINAINGFEFVMIDEEDIKQITFDEIYEEGEIDEDN